MPVIAFLDSLVPIRFAPSRLAPTSRICTLSSYFAFSPIMLMILFLDCLNALVSSWILTSAPTWRIGFLFSVSLYRVPPSNPSSFSRIDELYKAYKNDPWSTKFYQAVRSPGCNPNYLYFLPRFNCFVFLFSALLSHHFFLRYTNETQCRNSKTCSWGYCDIGSSAACTLGTLSFLAIGVLVPSRALLINSWMAMLRELLGFRSFWQ